MVHYYSLREIIKNVEIALEMLGKNDRFLFEGDASERSITHKLAEYLQKQFPDWNVDCEYNRKGLNPKSLRGIKECAGHEDSDLVYPDIIVHLRNENSNLLVIEVKKKLLSPKCDYKKLELFTDTNGDYGYRLGLFIEFEKNNNFLPRPTWFHRGKRIEVR
jgi:hypothetical protein